MDQESAAMERSSSEIRSTAATCRAACDTSESSGGNLIPAMVTESRRRTSREREGEGEGGVRNPSERGVLGVSEEEREGESNWKLTENCSG